VYAGSVSAIKGMLENALKADPALESEFGSLESQVDELRALKEPMAALQGDGVNPLLWNSILLVVLRCTLHPTLFSCLHAAEEQAADDENNNAEEKQEAGASESDHTEEVDALSKIEALIKEVLRKKKANTKREEATNEQTNNDEGDDKGNESENDEKGAEAKDKGVNDVLLQTGASTGKRLRRSNAHVNVKSKQFTKQSHSKARTSTEQATRALLHRLQASLAARQRAVKGAKATKDHAHKHDRTSSKQQQLSLAATAEKAKTRVQNRAGSLNRSKSAQVSSAAGMASSAAKVASAAKVKETVVSKQVLDDICAPISLGSTS
jgi:hypothetical protein